MTLTELKTRSRPLRVEVARGLLWAAQKIAPVTLHAEATREGRKVALLGLGTEVDDVAGLAIEAAGRMAGALIGAPDDEQDDEDGDDW